MLNGASEEALWKLSSVAIAAGHLDVGAVPPAGARSQSSRTPCSPIGPPVGTSLASFCDRLCSSRGRRSVGSEVHHAPCLRVPSPLLAAARRPPSDGSCQQHSPWGAHPSPQLQRAAAQPAAAAAGLRGRLRLRLGRRWPRECGHGVGFCRRRGISAVCRWAERRLASRYGLGLRTSGGVEQRSPPRWRCRLFAICTSPLGASLLPSAVSLAVGLYAIHRRRGRRLLVEAEGSLGQHEGATRLPPPATPLAAGAPPRQRWWGLPPPTAAPRQQQEQTIVVVQPDCGVALCVKEGGEAGGERERERQGGSRDGASSLASQSAAGGQPEHGHAAAEAVLAAAPPASSRAAGRSAGQAAAAEELPLAPAASLPSSGHMAGGCWARLPARTG